MKNQRILELDYLRSFAIIAIVFQHLFGYIMHPYATKTDVVLLSGVWFFVNLGVPTFIILSGFVLSNKYEKLENFSFKKFIKSRFTKLLIPYIIWSIIYTLWKDSQDNLFSIEQFKLIIQNLFTGKAEYHLWYIIMILQLYFLFPLLQKLVIWLTKKNQNKKLYFSILIIFLFQAVINYYYHYFSDYFFNVLYFFLNFIMILITSVFGFIPKLDREFIYSLYSKYSYLAFIFWIFFFMFGQLASSNYEFFKKKIFKIVPFFLPLWFGLFIILAYNFYLNIIYLKNGLDENMYKLSLYNPFVLFYIILTLVNLFAALIKFSKLKHSIIGNYLKVISDCSYGIYLAHPLVIKFITKYLYDIKFITPTVKVFLSTIIALIVIIIVMQLGNSFIRCFRKK